MNKISEVFADTITGAIIADDVLFFITIISFLVFIVSVIIIGLFCKKDNIKRYSQGIILAHLLMCSLLSFTSALMLKWWLAIIICIISTIGMKLRENNELKHLKEEHISLRGCPITIYAILSVLFYILGIIIVALHNK